MEGCTDLKQGYTNEQVELVSRILTSHDYFDILGNGERTCDLEKINNAYKKLSKEVNPEKNKAPGSDETFKKVMEAFEYSSPVHPYFLEVDNFYDYKLPMMTKEYGIEFYVRSSAEFDEKYHVGTNARTDIENKVIDDYIALVQKCCSDEIRWNLKRREFPTLIADEKLVGMEMRINDVLSSLKIGVQDVRMIGIKGIGGGGKTTLARAVYDQISNQFKEKSFVENMLHRKKLLIVLDDVNDTKQLEALCGASNWFNLGSRIIITTRDKQVLVAYRVNFIHSFVHKINLLWADEAICLFSSCLFLYGQDEIEWKDALERLKTILLEETMEKLEISCLEADYKEIFLDVSCLLEGWYEDEAIRALESCSFHARNGLRVLEQKSLIQISKYGVLDMHHHIQEMGKHIVCRLHPDEPCRHSRLWIDEEIEDILANNLLRIYET
nr:hypothetical protein [Tanacetum cinerariifolium]